MNHLQSKLENVINYLNKLKIKRFDFIGHQNLYYYVNYYFDYIEVVNYNLILFVYCEDTNKLIKHSKLKLNEEDYNYIKWIVLNYSPKTETNINID